MPGRNLSCFEGCALCRLLKFRVGKHVLCELVLASAQQHLVLIHKARTACVAAVISVS